MTKNTWTIAITVLILVLGAAIWLLRRGPDSLPATDLLSLYPTAEKRPAPDLFSLADATIGDETRKAIAIQPAAGTRLIFRTTLPNDGWLRTSIALDPKAWTTEGDGVLFRIGVSDGRAYDALFQQNVNPFKSEGDRRWIPVAIDLSAYGGRQVEIIFNTNASLPGSNDQRNDFALWGAPGIFLR